MRVNRSTVVLLGPQRLEPNAKDAIEPLMPEGAPVAVVTAGWEERESEHEELSLHLDRDIDNLELFRRSEQVLAEDPELHDALKQRFGQLRILQQLYRVRLRHLAPAAEELLEREGPEDLIEPEREAAFETLRTLDAHHLGRIAEIQEAFDARWRLAERPAIARHRDDIAAHLERAGGLCIAGGHVRVLSMRLWLFDLPSLIPAGMPIVAWSAGAMALAEKIVLFHDSPPQGKGFAEVLGPGLGLCPGIVPLPHARRRLHLENSTRVQLLSRRFPDSVCVALDAGSEISWDGQAWAAGDTTMELTPDGAVVLAGAS